MDLVQKVVSHDILLIEEYPAFYLFSLKISSPFLLSFPSLNNSFRYLLGRPNTV